jgi:hypothetical protein
VSVLGKHARLPDKTGAGRRRPLQNISSFAFGAASVFEDSSLRKAKKNQENQETKKKKTAG